jgi:hypothetical protein
MKHRDYVVIVKSYEVINHFKRNVDAVGGYANIMIYFDKPRKLW